MVDLYPKVASRVQFEVFVHVPQDLWALSIDLGKFCASSTINRAPSRRTPQTGAPSYPHGS